MRRLFKIIFLLFFIFINNCGNSTTEDLSIPLTGELKFNKDTYNSTNTPAVIQVFDNNLTSNSIQVKIVSISDPIGIVVELAKTSTNYYGYLNFSQSNSIAGSTIKIADGDLVMATYVDEFPSRVISTAVYWWDHIYYGILTETHISQMINYTMPHNDPNAGQFGFSATGTYNATEDTDKKIEGTLSHRVYIQDDGLILSFLNYNNLTLFENGSLCFSIIATNNMQLKLEWESGEHLVFLSNYISLTNTNWQHVSIPLNDFTGIDLSTMSVVFGLHWYSSDYRAYFWLDNVYLKK